MGVQSLYLGTVLTAGLLSFFSPCIVPLLPVYLLLFSSGGPSGGESPARRRLRVIRKSVLFVAGISVCFILLGFGAGALGSVIGSKPFMIVIGGIVIVLGLHQTGLVHIKWLYGQKKVELERSRRGDSLGFFVPFMALALFSDVLLTKVKKLNKYLGKIKTAGGVVIILMGILLVPCLSGWAGGYQCPLRRGNRFPGSDHCGPGSKR